MKKILWLDTETTGLNPKKHGIREIGYILVIDAVIKSKGKLYIDPRTYNKNIEIDNIALELSNITINDFNSYDDSAYSFDKFATLLEHVNKEDKNDYLTLAGFNVKFDNDFLREWFYDNEAGDDFKNYFHYKVLDVFPLVITLKHLGLIETENDKLKTVCKYFNIPIDAHTALSDIEATKSLYELISDRFINIKEEGPDRLAELEKVIRDYYLDKKYAGCCKWSFNVEIDSDYKSKLLTVHFALGDNFPYSKVFQTKEETTKEMFDKAFEYFSSKRGDEYDYKNSSK